MTKSFLFPEIDSERAVPAPNENGSRRCFSPALLRFSSGAASPPAFSAGGLPRRPRHRRRGWFALIQVFCTHSTWSYYCSIYRGESETLTVRLCGGWTPSEHVSTKEARSVIVTGVCVPLETMLIYGTGIALPPGLPCTKACSWSPKPGKRCSPRARATEH